MTVSISRNGDSCTPQAFISVNKNRQKFYNNAPNGEKRLMKEKTVYLPNQTNFEIELFNPTQNRIGAKIYLNGNSTSDLLIIRPGERYFLDRFLSDNKKLLFDVYDVSGSDDNVEKAIQNNGSVKVEFYKEYIKTSTPEVVHTTTYVPYPVWQQPHIVYPDWTYRPGEVIYAANAPDTSVRRFAANAYSANITGSARYINNTTNTTLNNTALTFSSNSTKELGTDGYLNFNGNPNPKLKKTKETGRVEMGENSNQKFKSTSFERNYSIPPVVVEYKLLPVSQKPLTTDDLVKEKMFCCQCGAKVKKSDKFCWSCGTKL